MLSRWWLYLLLAPVVLFLVISGLVALAVALIYPSLPSLDILTDYHPKQPLRVYSADGVLLGEFGEERRAFINIGNVPKSMKDAVLAIEDRRFYSHGGIDTKGVVRALVSNLSGSGRKEGASTITMQVARNFFLSSERSYKRKVNEALLALKIEHNLSKDQILELYINQIYLGQRAYGFSAASQIYFGKPLQQLNLAETALLAGLPKAPTAYNPFINPERAKGRQREVLNDMRRFGFIDENTYNEALLQPLRYKSSKKLVDLTADYVAEMIRQEMYDRYQDAIYSSGLKVYTTIIKRNQDAANQAVLAGLLQYDARHGYRGPEKNVEIDGTDLKSFAAKALDEIEVYNQLMPAIVTHVDAKTVKVITKSGQDITITGDGLALVKKILAEKKPPKNGLHAGSVVRVLKQGDVWHLVQLPQVEASFIALNPQTGAVTALVGGFSFARNKFNHVTQAWRQPGSTFKPFVYSASLEKGYTPATMIEDEPISIFSGGKLWQPGNYDGNFEGTMTMRNALTKSKNMVSIRILQGIGAGYAQDFVSRFGFPAKNHPAYLTMALGAGSVNAWQMAGGYAVFANGGYRIKPYLIQKVIDSNGKVLEQTLPKIAGKGAPKAIDRRNAFIMTSMMRDVVTRGTAAKARVLGREDLAGKTGTTNEHRDAWFAGYNPTQVAIAWVGYDKPTPLGREETGGKAALPIWINYMSVALEDVPDKPYQVPEGVTVYKIDPLTGTIAGDEEDARYDYFYHEYPPPSLVSDDSDITNDVTDGEAGAGDPAEDDSEAQPMPAPTGGAWPPVQEVLGH